MSRPPRPTPTGREIIWGDEEIIVSKTDLKGIILYANQTFLRIAIPLARPGIAAAGLLAFIFCWNNFVFALILASADKQPVTVGALAFVTASGIQYGQIAAAIVLSVTPTLALALYAQRYLVEGLSLGAVKG